MEMKNPLSPDVWRAVHDGRKSLTRDQLQAVLRSLAEPNVSRQNRALGELLVFSGCRVSEALALTRDHLDTDRNCVVIRTLKQRCDKALRVVPIPKTLTERLYQLPVGQDLRFWPFTRWTALRRLKPIFEAAGLTDTQATTRAFRHSVNAEAIRLGVPVRVRCALLGHSAVNTNDLYGDMQGYELTEFLRPYWDRLELET